MGQKTKRNYGKMTAAVNLVKSENSGVFGVKDISTTRYSRTSWIDIS